MLLLLYRTCHMKFLKVVIKNEFPTNFENSGPRYACVSIDEKLRLCTLKSMRVARKLLYMYFKAGARQNIIG